MEEANESASDKTASTLVLAADKRQPPHLVPVSFEWLLHREQTASIFISINAISLRV